MRLTANGGRAAIWSVNRFVGEPPVEAAEEGEPKLGFLHFAGLSDPIFVFCAGTTEVVVGLLIVTGTLPPPGTVCHQNALPIAG